MSRIGEIAFLLFFCVSYSSLFSQSEKKLEYEAQKNFVLEQSIETIAENDESENVDYTTLFDLLSTFYDKPINLNQKNITESLQQLQLLSDFQINNLLVHLEKNGSLMSIYELQAIEGFDISTIRNIMPFVIVSSEFYSPHISIKDLFKYAGNELYLRYSNILENQKGNESIDDSSWLASPNSRNLGSSDRLYLRYRFKFLTNLSIGFTAEKDAGESFFGNKTAEQLFNIKPKKGFDFYSAHFFIKNIGKIKALAMGDFHAQFGQGLTFWSGLAFGKSYNIMSLKRSAIGIRPYSSVDENNFLRGAATTLSFGNFEFTAFGSHKKIDANISSAIDSSANLDGISISSFQTTGLHSTVATLQDKDAILETHIGGHTDYKMHNLTLGVTGVHSFYGADINRDLQIYNQFDFNANQNTVFGLDYSFMHQNFNFFGEISRSENGGVGQIHGLLASLDPKLAFSALYRNYQRNYQSVLSNAIAENSKNTNEKGLLLGIEAKPFKQWIINAYMDQFKFPWMKYQTEQPNSIGFDFLFQTRYKPNRNLDMYFRVRNRQRPKNTDLELDDIDYVVAVDQWNFRYNIIYKISESLRLRNRVEYTTYQRGMSEKEQGFLIYQDIMYQPKSSSFSFNFRYALFDTDSYNSRIYSYENDVLYYFVIPAYYKRGTRTYLTIRYKVKRGIDVWLRWGQWYYNNLNQIGSGLNEISNNTKTEVRAQIRFSF